jgi:cation diffusion facilitator family transporter
MGVLLDQAKRVDTDNVSAETRKLYIQAIAVAIIGNVLLLAGKGAAAWLSGSSAIYADAANSAADVAYSLLMGLGLWLALRPPDPGHPHGHRRIESLVSLIIGATMAYAGYQAGRSGVATWLRGAEPIRSLWAYVAPVGTVLAKAGMFLLVRNIGEHANSPAIRASAKDNLTDVVSSAAALLGVAASVYLLPLADPVAAILVSVWILRSAWEVVSESVQHLVGGAPPAELSRAVEEAALGVTGVLLVHRVIMEYVGPLVRVDIHVNVDGNQSLVEAHDIGDAVQDAIEDLDEVDHAFVHIEPLRESVEAVRAGE